MIHTWQITGKRVRGDGSVDMRTAVSFGKTAEEAVERYMELQQARLPEDFIRFTREELKAEVVT